MAQNNVQQGTEGVRSYLGRLLLHQRAEMESLFLGRRHLQSFIGSVQAATRRDRSGAIALNTTSCMICQILYPCW